jgi:hypothetical protein
MTVEIRRSRNERNSRHVGIDPETSQLVSLFNPRTQIWREHFYLDNSRIVGRTRIGRATVRVLNMNAPRRVCLRNALLERGELSL